MVGNPYERVRDKHRAFAARLMDLSNVVGVGVGYKVTAGRQTDELAIAVSVTEKMPASQLPPNELVPRDVEGVTTDVVRTGPLYAIQADRQGKVRPARPGVSLGHFQVTAGTFGLVVRRDGELHILSNNHVLANVNEGQLGDPVYQPGPADGGTFSDKIAELAAYVPIRFPGDGVEEPSGCLASLFALFRPTPPPGSSAQDPPPNQVDAALARPTDPALISPDVLDVGVPTGVAEPTLNATVRKSGRTTGLTQSQVLQIDVTAEVNYGNVQVRFINQVMSGPMSRPGDSGSAILDEQGRVVGLLFAGSDYVTLFNPIQFVIPALGIEIVTA